ncbi:hypothetical protein PVAP13_8KG295984 [Panicum virgatum]|uniref:Uncharacterized protein n=1 Tax=Panicum virgatum TaxID=38727 RepID=A0A8T0PF07_PANVG|nr:hypothetical protein PVAP13_8KG295984 [Panicum virgatum]
MTPAQRFSLPCYEPPASTHHRVTPDLHKPAGEPAAVRRTPVSPFCRRVATLFPSSCTNPSHAGHKATSWTSPASKPSLAMAVPCTWPRERDAPSVPGLIVALMPRSSAPWPRHDAHDRLARTRTLPWPQPRGHATRREPMPSPARAAQNRAAALLLPSTPRRAHVRPRERAMRSWAGASLARPSSAWPPRNRRRTLASLCTTTAADAAMPRECLCQSAATYRRAPAVHTLNHA